MLVTEQEPMPLWFWAWFIFVFIAPVGLACLAAWDVKRRGLPWVRVIVWGILFWPVAVYLWGYSRRAHPGFRP